MTNWLIKIGWAKDRNQASLILLGIVVACLVYFVVSALFFDRDNGSEVRYEDLPPDIQRHIPPEAFQ